MRFPVLPALVLALGLASAGAVPTVTVVRLAVPGAVNAHVSLASAGATVAAAWAVTPEGGDTAVYAAISRDAGRTFGPPVRVAARADVGGEQPPRIVLTPSAGGSGTDVVVVWTAKSQAGTRLYTSRSRDGGRTFSGPAVVAGSEAAGNRGWQSVAVDAAGHPVVAWLDHRDAARSAGSGHQHAMHEAEARATPASVTSPSTAVTVAPRPTQALADTPRSTGATALTDAAEQSVARAAASRLYVGSTDGGVAVQGLVHGVCYCCKTALAAAPNGDLMLAWRHVFAGGYRDMAFSISRDAGRTFSTPVRVSRDGWQIAGCPEDGPALAIDPNRRGHIVWPTLVREGGRDRMTLFHSVTTNGLVFSERTRLPAGDSAFHPQVVVATNGDVVAAWDEGSAGTRRIRLARGRADAAGTFRFEVVDGFAPGGDHPALAVVPDGVLVAWASKTNTASGIELAVQPVR
jgi:hypothetical protein